MLSLLINLTTCTGESENWQGLGKNMLWDYLLIILETKHLLFKELDGSKAPDLQRRRFLEGQQVYPFLYSNKLVELIMNSTSNNQIDH